MEPKLSENGVEVHRPENSELMFLYLEYCKTFSIRDPDPHILLVLSHPVYDTLEVGEDFDVRNLLILETLFIKHGLFRHIKKLKFRKSALGNYSCLVLSRIFGHEDCHIDKVVLDTNGITTRGIKILGPGLRSNRSLRVVKLTGNVLGLRGSQILSDILASNNSVERLDIRNCDCGYPGISCLRNVSKIRQMKTEEMRKSMVLIEDQGNELQAPQTEPNTQFQTASLRVNKFVKNIQAYTTDMLIHGIDSNYYFEEILNSATHTFAFFLFVIPAFFSLMKKYSNFNSESVSFWSQEHHDLMFYSYLIYLVSLSLVFLSSSCLHGFFYFERTNKVFQTMDHVSISLLIAGTYTPLCFIAFGHTKIGVIWGVIVWFLAATNIYISTKKPEKWILELVIYILMGSAVLILVPFVWDVFPKRGWVLLISGALFYGVGVFFYLAGRKTPIFHVFWHIFVILGAVTHFFAIYYYDHPVEQSLLIQTKDSLMSLLAGE